jgi:hypothetical protein
METDITSALVPVFKLSNSHAMQKIELGFDSGAML